MAIKSHQVWVLSCEGDQIIRHSAIEIEHPGPAGCIVNHLRPAPVRVIIADGATTGDLIGPCESVRARSTSNILPSPMARRSKGNRPMPEPCPARSRTLQSAVPRPRSDEHGR